MHNITDYLLLPEQAMWARDNGFDGQCCGWADHTGKYWLGERGWLVQNSECLEDNSAIPTFDQFFDWVEEKWGIQVRIDDYMPKQYFIEMWHRPIINGVYNNTNIPVRADYPDKRSARIACVNAIIQYIDNLK